MTALAADLPRLNDPEALADLTVACDRCEAALMGNDPDTLDALFWNSNLTLRDGIAENLCGIAIIRDFRTGRTGGSPPRAVSRREIVTFGTDFVACNLAFCRLPDGPSGRQSQTWMRMPDGWRIVAAHVSLMQVPP